MLQCHDGKYIMTSLLVVDDLKVHHKTARGMLRAVDGVSLEIEEGDVLGLVGESGCGKSTLARAVTGLTNPTSGHISGTVREGGRRQRARAVQMIFQDPIGSLNPRQKIGRTLDQAFRLGGVREPEERRRRIVELLRQVGLPEDYMHRFPHELSGGQCQRIGIARALAMTPKLVVCDEAVSALDVSVQAQVLNLLLKLQRDRRLSYLFISHDLGVVRYVSKRVAVMFMGKVVEIGPVEAVWSDHRHPYTRALVDAAPGRELALDRLELTAEVPSPVNPPSGCNFRVRCPLAREVCAQRVPALEVVSPGHFAACHFPDALAHPQNAHPAPATTSRD
jgi:oligopeptide/dipeptide ABC transporter ATP-binding protein